MKDTKIYNSEGTAARDENSEKNRVKGGTLYLVATPIGNMADLSERAIKVLSEVDFIAAEDTRNTAKLLFKIGISKPMISYFEHNKRERGEYISNRLMSGEACALVTDAGTPAISDPGEDITVLCIERGIPVTSVPGPCAAINALILSGLSTKSFVFEGFLSSNKHERREKLAELSHEKRTFILYEAPHHLKDTLNELHASFGDRKLALCRELTKLNEDIMRCTLSQAVAYYSEHEPRGEYVLVIEGNSESFKADNFWDGMTPAEHVEFYINTGMPKNEAIKAAAKDRGLKKNDVYRELFNRTDDDKTSV